MAKFEVHIPAQETTGFNFTFRIEAENWMSALKAGMAKIGEETQTGQNVLVDVQDDNSLHVTDATSGRVFQIRELTEAESAAAAVKKKPAPARPAPAAPPPSAPAPAPVRAEPAREPVRPEGRAEVRAREPVRVEPSRRDTPLDTPFAEQPGATVIEGKLPSFPPVPSQPVRPGPAAPQRPEARTLPEMPVTIPRPAARGPEPVMPEHPSPSPTRADALPMVGMSDMGGSSADRVAERLGPIAEARQKLVAKAAATAPKKRNTGKLDVRPDQVEELERPTRPVAAVIGRAKDQRATEDQIEALLTEVFERVQDIHALQENDALYYLLDLALEKIPCESGSVFHADAGSGDLTFAAARGPAAPELLRKKLVIPAGTGIVGFCEVESVSVALSDVQKDPRYYAAIAAKVNYETRSVLCSPMITHGRTFGCIQLINRKSSPLFASHEVGLLAYIAHQAALYLNARD